MILILLPLHIFQRQRSVLCSFSLSRPTLFYVWYCEIKTLLCVHLNIGFWIWFIGRETLIWMISSYLRHVLLISTQNANILEKVSLIHVFGSFILFVYFFSMIRSKIICVCVWLCLFQSPMCDNQNVFSFRFFSVALVVKS